LRETLTRDLAGARVEALREYPVGNASGMYAVYSDSFGPDLAYYSVAIYVAKGQSLYKFHLSHHAGDPAAAQFLAAFEQVVSGARLPD
jgi:hypothetical protein